MYVVQTSFACFCAVIKYSNLKLTTNVIKLIFLSIFLLPGENWTKQRHSLSFKKFWSTLSYPRLLLWMGGPWRVSIVRGGSQGEIDGALRLSLPSPSLTDGGQYWASIFSNSCQTVRRRNRTFLLNKHLVVFGSGLLSELISLPSALSSPKTPICPPRPLPSPTWNSIEWSCCNSESFWGGGWGWGSRKGQSWQKRSCALDFRIFCTLEGYHTSSHITRFLQRTNIVWK